MKVAIIGSRGLAVKDFSPYLPKEVTEIVSGGAVGIDRSARQYAKTHGLKLTEFLPDYEQHGRKAPLLRNLDIIDYSDLVLAFWDSRSRGTAFVIKKCHEQGKPIRIFVTKKEVSLP